MSCEISTKSRIELLCKTSFYFMSTSFTIMASQFYLISFLAACSTDSSTPSQAASSLLRQPWLVN